MRWFSLCLPLLALTTSCTRYTWDELKTSSLDFNNNRVHRLVLKNADPASVVDRMTALAETRHVALVFSACKHGVCECSFKREAETVSAGATGTIQASLFGAPGASDIRIDQKSVSISSLFFSRITRKGDDTIVEMLGVPVVYENVVSCPMSLEVERRCRRVALRVPAGKAPEEVFRSEMGVDISGKREAQIIAGVFTQLRRADRTVVDDDE